MTVLSVFLCGSATCFASGGIQPLEEVVAEATLIFKAKVLESNKGSDKWGHLHIKVELVETLKGDLKDKSLLLNFQAMLYSEEVNDPDMGKVKLWNMVPQSGKELKMRKDEVWIFFSYSGEKNDKGFLQVFRGEPADLEQKIKDLLKSKTGK